MPPLETWALMRVWAGTNVGTASIIDIARIRIGRRQERRLSIWVLLAQGPSDGTIGRMREHGAVAVRFRRACDASGHASRTWKRGRGREPAQDASSGVEAGKAPSSVFHRAQIADRQALVPGLEHATHDLSAPGLGELVAELDLARGGVAREMRLHVLGDLLLEAFRRLVAHAERDERLHDLTPQGIGLADHAGLGHRGVRDERGFDLEGPDPFARRIDHVVGSALEPEVTVHVDVRRVAGEVPAGEA